MARFGWLELEDRTTRPWSRLVGEKPPLQGWIDEAGRPAKSLQVPFGRDGSALLALQHAAGRVSCRPLLRFLLSFTQSPSTGHAALFAQLFGLIIRSSTAKAQRK